MGNTIGAYVPTYISDYVSSIPSSPNYCSFCRKTTNHTTSEHKCSVCGVIGDHAAYDHTACTHCLAEDHDTAQHPCDFCLSEGHREEDHACDYCDGTHESFEHECSVCGLSGHEKDIGDHEYCSLCSDTMGYTHSTKDHVAYTWKTWSNDSERDKYRWCHHCNALTYTIGDNCFNCVSTVCETLKCRSCEYTMKNQLTLYCPMCGEHIICGDCVSKADSDDEYFYDHDVGFSADHGKDEETEKD